MLPGSGPAAAVDGRRGRVNVRLWSSDRPMRPAWGPVDAQGVADDWQPGWAFLLTTAAGERIGPVRSELAYVHRAARESVGMSGGVCVVLRGVEGGWRAVASYTDGGAKVQAVKG